VLSFHDFRGRPADLYRKIASMQEHDCASVIKVAFLARSIRDAIEALHLPSTISRPTIALAMGDFGIMSRILAPKFGAFLTFATLRPALATAPGQPTLSELLNVYNFRRINPRTAVYGIVGWPVAHSKSPLVHNAGFLKIGFDGVYVPMPVVHGDDAESGYASFKASLLELLGDDRLTFRGCSVTLPHKENLVRLAHEMGWLIDPLARRAGAGNTLVVHEDGTRVLNTDVAAVISCVRSYFTSPPRQVLLLGAGGAARAAGVAMREMGALVRVASRTAEKASRLCTEMGAGWSAASWEDPLAIEDQLVVQCTPLGMLGGPDASANPLAESSLQRLHVPVFETVYTPRETPFVKAALSRGVHAIYGRDMFIQQARLQFEAWTGQQAPLDVFQEALNSGA
jgi:3-dehydroquinate dehydratase/shikimate dehydrogenase